MAIDSYCDANDPVIPPKREIATVLKAPDTARQIAQGIKRDKEYGCPEYRKKQVTSR